MIKNTDLDIGISSHENKRALSSFYHKNSFDKNECKTPYGVLHLFFIKSFF